MDDYDALGLLALGLAARVEPELRPSMMKSYDDWKDSLSEGNPSSEAGNSLAAKVGYALAMLLYDNFGETVSLRLVESGSNVGIEVQVTPIRKDMEDDE